MRYYLRRTLGLTLFLYFAAHLVLTFPVILGFISPIVQDPNGSLDAKLVLRLGQQYELVSFIRAKTPENAVLLMGPGWNGTRDRSLLFPRQVYFGDERTFRAHPEINYIVIYRDYPGYPVSGQRIMLDEHRGVLVVQR